MQTIESLKRKIKSTQDLLSVVKTMKALAAVSIRQYQRAVESLTDYNRTVEMGLQIALKAREESEIPADVVPARRAGAIVFGSAQGLCGQFNTQIVSYALEELDSLNVPLENRTMLAIGERVKDQLERAGHTVYDTLFTPSSTAGVAPMVQEIMMILEEWHFSRQIQHIYLIYNHYISGAAFQPRTTRLLPVDRTWLNDIRSRPWESRTLPMFTMDWDTLFLSLLREYFFVSLFQAFTESLASENASRLAAMQNAEKNIGEHLEEIFAAYHRRRQMTITEELLDIVSGYEAMEADTRLPKKGGKGPPAE
ncbi:MAG: ATP synthase gamma chain, sodium ion specific [Deltaproteobacteria bacterium ADurb.BinA179]|jgi:F-type H+-transporting ATPase subunit gamma|nr:F0F1 ATP synthase subunit gamma [Deltaproteobacteria bacterium]MDI9542311.1 F0F1 ATP synthase subunit gamma [Pseudomonadota bacterium]OPZ30272.1 MAG: ATP synthase gamma chain, sodium ion specific [Deltaproteobacteria bacterium ADurb.BinA179]HNU75610.1 F0F1 ATP synthase subunit gamma [Deltaproteobacteria bacterium]HOD69872.1 F0F1 ATP synthase subunit gamma [Deltaproteobacteria bacterium]